MLCYYDGSLFGFFDCESQFLRYLEDNGWKIDHELIEYDDQE